MGLHKSRNLYTCIIVTWPCGDLLMTLSAEASLTTRSAGSSSQDVIIDLTKMFSKKSLFNVKNKINLCVESTRSASYIILYLYQYYFINKSNNEESAFKSSKKFSFAICIDIILIIILNLANGFNVLFPRIII